MEHISNRHIKEAKEFNFKAWEAIDKHSKCLEKHYGDDVEDLVKELWHGIMEKSSYHSLNCYIQFLTTSTRYWKLVTNAEIQKLIEDSYKHFGVIETARAKLISHESTNPRYNWKTPAVGALSNEEL